MDRDWLIALGCVMALFVYGCAAPERVTLLRDRCEPGSSVYAGPGFCDSVRRPWGSL